MGSPGPVEPLPVHRCVNRIPIGLLRLPIARGPLRGMWWLVGSHGKLGRVLTGGYEREQTELFARVVRRGQTVLDLGAHVGYYTLLCARLVGKGGRVIAFEPDAENQACLRGHVRANSLRNVLVVPAAVGFENGTAAFASGLGSGKGRLSVQGKGRVQVVSLDSFVTEHDLKPDLIKMDVEGAELDALMGGEQMLRRYRPLLAVSTHSPFRRRRREELTGFLRDLGYAFEPIGSNVHELFFHPAERNS